MHYKPPPTYKTGSLNILYNPHDKQQNQKFNLDHTGSSQGISWTKPNNKNGRGWGKKR